MKKFLLPLMLTFAILIPSVQAQAAYVLVPDFYDIASNRNTFDTPARNRETVTACRT